MRDWNLILTVIPGPRHERTVLNQIGWLGRFAHSPFKDVCIGRVDDVPQFLEDVHAAQASGERWANKCGVALIARELSHRYPFIQAR